MHADSAIVIILISHFVIYKFDVAVFKQLITTIDILLYRPTLDSASFLVKLPAKNIPAVTPIILHARAYRYID